MPVTSAMATTPRAVAQTRHLHHDVDGGGKLSANHFVGNMLAGHHHHGLEPREGVPRRVGVDGGHRAVVTRVHGVQHVQRLGPTRFAHDDAVRAHTEGVDHQVALRNRARAFDVDRARFEAHHVRLLELQLGRILDGDDALLLRDKAGERVEHGGLTRARSARDHHVEAGFHAAAEKIQHPCGESIVLEQIFRREDFLSVTADRDHRPDQGQRRNHGADTRSVGKARVHDGRRIVNAAADRRNNALDNQANVVRILETDIGFHHPPAALDVDVIEAVDQNVADGGIFQQGLERA